MARIYITLTTPKDCRGCLFLCDNACDFIGQTGRARTPICKPGKDCTVKATTHERKDEIHSLYGRTQRASDAERARNGGFARAEKLKNNRGRKMSFDELAAWNMYEHERLNDAAIAQRIGVDQQVIARWRVRRGYPANYDCRNQLVDREPTEPPGMQIKHG